MKKKADKERIMTELLDDYLIRKRAGESPKIEQFTQRYPEYAEEIREAFSEEMDWMMKFSKVAEKSELTSSAMKKDMAWNRLLAKIDVVKDQKESAMSKSSVFADVTERIWESIREIVSDLFEFIFSIPKAVKIAIPSLAIAVVVLFLIFTPSQNYSDLAKIEKVPYIPLVVKGAIEIEKVFEEGMEFYNEGQYPEAIKKLEAEIKIDPNNINTQFYLGLCYLLDEKVDKGIDHLKKAIELGGNSLLEMCHWYLGNAYLLIEDGDKALEEFRKVMEIEGNYEWQAEEMIAKIEKVKHKKEK